MASEPFVMANLCVSVFNAEWKPLFHSCRMSAPVAMNNAQPIKLKKISIRLLIGVLKMYPINRKRKKRRNKNKNRY